MLAQLKSQGRQLLPWLSYLSHEIQALSSPAARARRRDEIAFIQNLGLTYDPDAGPVPAPSSESPCILFLSIGVVALSVVERLIAAAFERAGYRVVMILARDFRLRQAYRELGLSSCTAWQDFRPAPEAGLRMAAEALAGIATMEDLLALRREGVQAGKFALATTIRHLRCIDLDFSDGATRQVLVDQLGHSFTAIDGARRLLDRFRPAGVIMVDRGYTPNGEISESCTARGIPVYTYNFVHRSNLILMKRFGPHNQDQHHHSLSAPTWQAMQGIPWTERRFRQLIDEIDGAYRSGDWYSEVGTQRDTRLVARAELIDRLGLEPGRKVVGLFPHIFWDATFFWGRDLFRDYRDWFCQTLQAACANDRFSWVIKVHPANRVKSRRDGHQGEHSEITAIRAAGRKVAAGGFQLLHWLPWLYRILRAGYRLARRRPEPIA